MLETLMGNSYLRALAIFLFTLILAVLVRKVMNRAIKRASEKLDKNPTTFKFMRHVLMALVYLIGFGLAARQIESLNALGASMLAGAGMLTVIFGFASQAALANVVAGIFIVIFRPYKVNDRIRVKGEFAGVVEDINLRHTVIRNFESQRVIIPNSVMSTEAIVNNDLTDGNMCRWVELHISFESDIDLAKRIMAEECEKHKNLVDNRTEEQKENGAPLVQVRVIQITPYSILLRAWAWTSDSATGFELYCDVIENIKKRFDAEGIVIPYPRQQLEIQDTNKLQ